MEEGRLTDSFGRNVDFKNAILIMTTNAGAEAIKNESAFGFQKPSDDSSYESMKERVHEQIEKVFRPEFVGRCDDIIVFRHLTEKDLGAVVELELKKVRDRLLEKGLKLLLSEDAVNLLIKKGSNLDFGARPLRRAIEGSVEDPLSEELLKGEFDGKEVISVDVKLIGDKKQLVFNGMLLSDIDDISKEHLDSQYKIVKRKEKDDEQIIERPEHSVS
jgi:ATP-dependent Clp protease ATP-binding subunit ClpC